MKMNIPQNGKYAQPNNSDLFGNVHYTKNINFDEEGYLKLSARVVSLRNEEVNPNFGLPNSFGRYDEGLFYIVTDGDPYKLEISSTAITPAQDTDSGGASVPGMDSTSFGRWWQNRWYITSSDDKLYYKTPSTGNWTDVGAATIANANLPHPIEVFRNRNTMCIGDGNVVRQINTSHSTVSLDLTLPAGFEIIGLSYSGNRMGVITRLSSTVEGQNQEALFFAWDGTTTSANQGIPVGSDAIVAIVPYKSSWVVLTRLGELLYWNGGGWTKLTALPYYYKDAIMGDFNNRFAFGDILQAEGDLIYINITSTLERFGRKEERYLPNNIGGVLCYDPVVGLYHRYSPSASVASLVSVIDSNVNTTTDIFVGSGTLPETGNPVKYISSSATQIGGLTIGTVYYIIKLSSMNFKLAHTKAEALAGEWIDITTAGAATNYFMALDLVDYSVSRVGDTAAVALMGSQSQSFDHVIFGADCRDTNSLTDYSNLCISVPGFENRGYMVTSKILFRTMEDSTQRLLIRNQPLRVGEKIIAKYKDKDIIGIPVTTPQNSNTTCTWTSNTVLTTTANLSEVEAFMNDTDYQEEERQCEVEITSGAGAGQMAQISTISVLSGTYTITLDEELDGVEANDTCDILIENWKLLGEITSDNNDKGWYEFPIYTNSKWVKFKIELRGDQNIIEDLQIETETHI